MLRSCITFAAVFSLLCGTTPAVGTTATATENTAAPTCTPPLCASDEVLHCPEACPGGCGTICAVPTPTPTPLPSPCAPSCPDDCSPADFTPVTGADCGGDCNGDAVVSISDLTRAVSIALGRQSIEQCEAADGDSNGEVTVRDLIGAVRGALNLCPAGSLGDFVGVYDVTVSAPSVGPSGSDGSALVSSAEGVLAIDIFSFATLRGPVQTGGVATLQGVRIVESDVELSVTGGARLSRFGGQRVIEGAVESSFFPSDPDCRSFSLERPAEGRAALEIDLDLVLQRQGGSRHLISIPLSVRSNGIASCGAGEVIDASDGASVASLAATDCSLSPSGRFVLRTAYSEPTEPFSDRISFFGSLQETDGMISSGEGTFSVGLPPLPVESGTWSVGDLTSTAGHGDNSLAHR